MVSRGVVRAGAARSRIWCWDRCRRSVKSPVRATASTRTTLYQLRTMYGRAGRYEPAKRQFNLQIAINKRLSHITYIDNDGGLSTAAEGLSTAYGRLLYFRFHLLLLLLLLLLRLYVSLHLLLNRQGFCRIPSSRTSIFGPYALPRGIRPRSL